MKSRTMRQWRRLTASLLLLIALAICGPAATSAGASGPQVIRLVRLQTSLHQSGKQATWTNVLLNAAPQFGKPTGARVGAEVGFSHGAQLDGAIRLPGGVLEYSGKARHLPRHGGIVVPVVDGSGVFAQAAGTYTVSEADKRHPNRTVLVLRLG